MGDGVRDRSEPGVEAPASSRRSGLRRLATDFAPGPVLAPGTVIAGRYRIVRRLGTGGMGAVYEAEQTAIGRRVALKVVRPELANDESIAERFRREARAASRIRSAHVVVVHDFGGGEDDSPLYLVMEFLEGETLEARLAGQGALPPRDAVEIAKQVASALEAAHAAGVVHRDLKPANVLLPRNEPLKVVDFGIARMLESDEPAGGTKMTQAGTLLGTPAYMSPEACLRKTVGPAADLYALGVMLFEMLTGQLPLEDEEPILLLGLHARVPPPRLRDERPELSVPDALEELVDRLLAKKPEERPASARAVIDALAALDWSASRRAAPVPAPVAAPVVIAPAGGRNARLIAGVAIGGALIAAVTVVLAMMSGDGDAAAPVAPGGQRAGGSVETLAPAQPRQQPRSPSVTTPTTHVVTARETVRFTIAASPPETELHLDGARIVPGTVELERTGRIYTLEARAPGHIPQTLSLSADQDRTLAIELTPSDPPPAGTKRRGGRPVAAAPETGPPAKAPPPPPGPGTPTGRAQRLSEW
jgi:serine/threonine-protein kinase